MSNKIAISLLAPARNLNVGIAAINAGADAVYIGAPAFSARQAAGCSIDDIRQLCQYAHLFSAKVLVALNTLLTSEELPSAVQMIWDLYHAGADAIIVQDFQLLDQHLPPIRLHASTQCDNRTIEDVQDRIRRGFKRVVLARELGLQQIRDIRDYTLKVAQSTHSEPIELEAFVHGALCVCYSGRCYMSEQVLGRSANRGNCAQLCRWKYDLLDKDMRLISKDQYALSLRDLDRSRNIQSLLDAGVTTLKIEGRLKDEEYVRNITAYYRQLLDQLFALPDSVYCKASLGNVYLDFKPNPEKTFHRSHTDYFLHERTEQLANWQTPKSTGEYIGKVAGVRHQQIEIILAPDVELHNGDGLCFGNNGFFINSVSKLNSPVRKVCITANHSLDINIGTELYRNLDIEFNKALTNSRTTRKLPIDIVFDETDDGFCLKIGSQHQHFRYDKTIATNQERAEQNIRTCLTKLGDTPFEVNTLQINLTQPYFIPASVLNSWRRTVTDVLLNQSNVSPNNPHNVISTNKPISNITPPSTDTASFHTPRPINTPLMTCRYCILFEMGICRKQGRKKEVVEPAFLKSGNHLFSLHFDCQHCQMTISNA